MSLYIDIDEVTDVLISDGWYTVLNKSFCIDSYEYHFQEMTVHSGGSGGISDTGFQFYGYKNGYEENKNYYYGPLSSILMIVRKNKKKSKGGEAV